MFVTRRSAHNPILTPHPDNPWESFAAFNGCPIETPAGVHLLYRAMSHPEQFENHSFSLSTIGKADSKDGIHFKSREEFIVPELEWERYGCEDPRITKVGKKYYIFYTALSTFPFSAPGIKVAVAISSDMKTIDEKHLVTPFNAKAMSLFPKKINGKFTAILTANTDMPPSKIAIAQFDKEEDMWSEEYWKDWYANLDKHSFELRRNPDDQVEIGAPPIETKHGWLIIYSHIPNYGTDKRVFRIEAVLLDKNDPRKIIARTHGPILVPEESYEKFGIAPDIIFPSGCLIHDDETLRIYYGGADTVCAMAEVRLDDLLMRMLGHSKEIVVRAKKNPILSPTKNDWEGRAVFNPSAIDLASSIHILYRAMSEDNTSTIGYARTDDGLKIKQRLDYPIYKPTESFEGKGVPNGNSGCEDPRLTLIGKRIYMCYTAYNGTQPPGVALTSISTDDFLDQQWNWDKPIIISPAGQDDKDACILPMINNAKKNILIHRLNNAVCASHINVYNPRPVDDHVIVMRARPGMWDSQKVGICAPPVLTKHGWLLTYHGVSDDSVYRVGLALLDKDDPTKVISRTTDFIFEPEEVFEKVGQVNNVVFPCGSILRGNDLYLYYGGADSVTGVAVADVRMLLKILLP